MSNKVSSKTSQSNIPKSQAAQTETEVDCGTVRSFDFSRTLVIGASVSAAVLERSPSKRFLRSEGKLTHAITHAYPGAPGVKVLSQFKKSSLEGRTAVLAVDLMFWDSVMGLAEPRESLALFRGFINEIERRELDLVIGNIPSFHPLQVNRDEINAGIEKECTRLGDRARILRLDSLFDGCITTGGFEMDGRHYTISDLLPDGLHPSSIAAEAIAREIRKCVRANDSASSVVGELGAADQNLA